MFQAIGILLDFISAKALRAFTGTLVALVDKPVVVTPPHAGCADCHGTGWYKNTYRSCDHRDYNEGKNQPGIKDERSKPTVINLPGFQLTRRQGAPEQASKKGNHAPTNRETSNPSIKRSTGTSHHQRSSRRIRQLEEENRRLKKAVMQTQDSTN